MASSGNIAVLPGHDGNLLIDAGIGVLRPRISQALASINSDPVKHLINTHWHFAHTGGNEWLHSAGAAILAHENTGKHLSVASRVDDWNFTFWPSPAGAIPTATFKADHTLRVNGMAIALEYYGPSHTDSDISVHFTEADVFHTGDTWWNGVYPFIDDSTGGGIDGQIRAAEANNAAVTATTIVTPGHGPVGGRSDVVEFRDMLVAIRENVAALKKQGRFLEETIAAKPTAAYDGKGGQILMNPAMFTGLVYAGV
jgi:glyoxylase-like metal-dependent hydrolase (beta-lactamase superfamily II)